MIFAKLSNLQAVLALPGVRRGQATARYCKVRYAIH